MPELLSPELEEMRSTLQNFVASELSDWEAEAASSTDAATLQRLRATVAARSAELGIFKMTQPRDVGGLAASQLEIVVVQESLARANLPLLSGAVLGGGAGPLSGATGRLRDEYLMPSLKGQLRGSFGFTEPGGNTPRTIAVKDGDDLVITGHKSFVTGGDSANFCAALVNLREADGETKAGTAMVIIDLLEADKVSRPHGVIIHHKFESLDGGMSHAYIRFEGVRVPSWHIIQGDKERKVRVHACNHCRRQAPLLLSNSALSLSHSSACRLWLYAGIFAEGRTSSGHEPDR